MGKKFEYKKKPLSLLDMFGVRKFERIIESMYLGDLYTFCFSSERKICLGQRSKSWLWEVLPIQENPDIRTLQIGSRNYQKVFVFVGILRILETAKYRKEKSRETAANGRVA